MHTHTLSLTLSCCLFPSTLGLPIAWALTFVMRCEQCASGNGHNTTHLIYYLDDITVYEIMLRDHIGYQYCNKYTIQFLHTCRFIHVSRMFTCIMQAACYVYFFVCITRMLCMFTWLRAGSSQGQQALHPCVWRDSDS